MLTLHSKHSMEYYKYINAITHRLYEKVITYINGSISKIIDPLISTNLKVI